ncbi:MAG: group I intron-associated PD-(D/E)XK endonuclease [Candidatus Anammoxibacter sp.]
MNNISDLQAGKAGEYLVCADLILNEYVAYPSEQGLPYDVILDNNGILFKIQVKSTRTFKYAPQRKTKIPAYIFHIGLNGKGGKHKKYQKKDVDIFALVVLDTKKISYLPFFNHKTTMNFRVPEWRGRYHDEQAVKIKSDIVDLRKKGKTCREIAIIKDMKLSNVNKYSANVSLKQRGGNSGVYFDEFTLERCLNGIFINSKL